MQLKVAIKQTTPGIGNLAPGVVISYTINIKKGKEEILCHSIIPGSSPGKAPRLPFLMLKNQLLIETTPEICYH